MYPFAIPQNSFTKKTHYDIICSLFIWENKNDTCLVHSNNYWNNERRIAIIPKRLQL